MSTDTAPTAGRIDLAGFTLAELLTATGNAAVDEAIRKVAAQAEGGHETESAFNSVI